MSQRRADSDSYALIRLQAETGTWYWVVHFKRCGKLHYRRLYEPKHGGNPGARQQPQRRAGRALSGFQDAAAGFWQARLKLAGQPAQYKSFSVRKHGKQRAYQLAVQARHQMLAQADNELYLYAEVARRTLQQGASAQAGGAGVA